MKLPRKPKLSLGKVMELLNSFERKILKFLNLLRKMKNGE